VAEDKVGDRSDFAFLVGARDEEDGGRFHGLSGMRPGLL
jgi:hypothetical protein